MLSVINSVTKELSICPIANVISSIKISSCPTQKSVDEILSIRKTLLSKSNEGSVDLYIDNKLATITINNTHKKNAITEKMMVDLFDCVTYLSHWNGNFILLKGNNHTFCSGFDLEATKKYTNDPDGKLLLSLFMQDTCNRLKRLSIPSCSFIEGYAIGGGAEITTATDFRVMSSNAKVRFVHATLGLSPSWGGASRLSQIIGYHNALHYLSSASVITSDIAKEINYADACLEEKEIESFYKPYLQNFTGSIHAIKTILSEMEENIITPDIMQTERQCFEQLFGSQECKEGLSRNTVVQKYTRRK